ncbi:hypothetical protein [Clostridium aminobutyricum]|uniref:Uncharacterized protein n=1 Tax=Clostridium aminobutyricum TaxID=33953 RepID=A0A939IGM7_CLOAM|nr:hypothetical protein [Clostridium aminobutyricum]MBN7773560.1 hypothetical protein [Clostridium aminobutyricum]
MLDKLPPIEKIYEAYSAIADNRIILHADHAAVLSSDRSKEYTVAWDGNLYTSDDNATYWQGYAGYPVIAVLMKQEKLPLDRRIASYFAGINWTELNTKYKRNYTKAAAAVLDNLQCSNDEKEQIQTELHCTYEAIKLLDIKVKRSSPRRSKREQQV